jgi:uncharacterized alkaline shock family protein YloU
LKKQKIDKRPLEMDDRAPGTTTIDPDVLLTIARLTTQEVPGVSRSEGVHIEIREDTVSADLYIILKNDVNIREVSRQVQQQVTRAISEMVGMRVGRVNVHIEDIDYSPETEITKEG